MQHFITSAELAQGYVDLRMTDDRRDKINWLIHLGQPIRMSQPQRMGWDTKICSCVLPVSIEPVKDSQNERVNFIPIICRAMTIGKLRSGLLAKVVLELDGEQWMFSAHGVDRCKYRFDGLGVDPQVAEDSVTELARLIQSDHDHPAMMRLYGWLKGHFNPKGTPCLV